MISLCLLLLTPVQQADEIDDIRSQIKGLATNFSSSFSYSTSTGDLYTGEIYYQYPNKLHIQLSDKRVIATNGKYLWVYEPETKICARQMVKEETSGGLFYLLKGGYTVQEENGRYIFKRPGALMHEVTIKVENSILKSIQFKVAEDIINVSFSNVVTNTGMKASLFNYKPDPDAQLIENPLNKIGNFNLGNAMAGQSSGTKGKKPEEDSAEQNE